MTTRYGQDRAIVAGMQQAVHGFAGTSKIADDAGDTLEEFINALIDNVLAERRATPMTETEKQDAVITALRSIGFDYSADKIREARTQ